MSNFGLISAYLALLSLLSCFHPSHSGAVPHAGRVDIHAFRSIRKHGPLEHLLRTQLLEDGPHFHPQSVMQVGHIGVGPHSDAMTARGLFSLDLMLERNLITREQHALFSQIGSGLEAGQVQFYEFTRWYTAADAEQRFSSIPASWIVGTERGGPDAKGEQLLQLRRAALWSVSGQLLDPRSPSGRVVWERKKVPIQLAPDFSAAVNWPFTADEMIFEWGRAGRLEEDSLPRLAQLATLHNLSEVLALGSDPQKAWVVVGASDAQHLRLYRDSYGFEEFGQNGKNQLLRRRLSDLLEDPRIVPGKISKKVARIRQLSQEARVIPGGLTELASVRLLSELKTLMKVPLDIEPPSKVPGARRSPPIWLIDRSDAFTTQALKLLTNHGLAPVKEKVSDFLRQQRTIYQPVGELASNVVDPSLWEGSRSIFVSGLDEWSEANPEVNPLVPLVASYRYYLKKVLACVEGRVPPGLPEKAMEWGLAQQLDQGGVGFTVFVKNRALAERFRAAGVVVEPVDIVMNFKGHHEETDWHKFQQVKTPGWRVKLSPMQLFRTADDLPSLPVAAPGYWQALMHLHGDLTL